MKKIYLGLIVSLFTTNLIAQSFTEITGTSFTGVSESSMAFSDIDNDGDKDVLIIGRPANSNPFASTKLYKNDGNGVFTEVIGTLFTNIYQGSVAFSDIDSDGDEDVLIIGLNNSNQQIAELYKNDGNGVFTQVLGTLFTGTNQGSVAFSDIDSDGDEDVLITGYSVLGRITRLYSNDGTGIFTLVTGTPFDGVSASSVAFSDINNDGDEDVLITGLISGGVYITKLYENDGFGVFTEVMGTPFDAVFAGSIAFSDVDNDGDEDVLITGSKVVFVTNIAKLYKNDGNGVFTEVIGTSFPEVFNSFIVFSDIDNDGDEDVLITGDAAATTSIIDRIAKIYSNDGTGTFSLVTGTPFDGVELGSVAFSDIDNDGDEDVLITGFNNFTHTTKLYKNNLIQCSSTYTLGDVSPTCSNTTFCVPLQATTSITNGLMGVDFTLDYDPAIMTPTGNVTMGSVATAYGAYGINTSTLGKVLVTVYLDGAPPNIFLNGAGDIACVEFTVNAGITNGTTSTISVDGSVLEGIAGNPTCPVTPSTFTFTDDNILQGFVRYQNKNARPLLYDAGNPTTYKITDIKGVDAACANPSTNIAPDLTGNFSYDINNGTSIQFERDIIGDFSVPQINCNNVMAVINSTDRNQALNIVTLTNPSPTVYQLLSADVNLDGIVSSQDVSMITSRTINNNYCEFNQGNYVWDAGSSSYVPVAGYTKSKDWLFIDATTINSPTFTAGMSKNNVPQVPDCLPVNVVNNGTCNQIASENYEAILLGDVNGNWNTVNAADAKAGEPFTLVFDIDNAVLNGSGNYEVPVSYIANTAVTAVNGIDFSMDFDGTRVNVMNADIDVSLPTMLKQWKNHSNELFMFTAFDNNTITTTGTVAFVEFQSTNGILKVQDLGEIIAYVNGEPAEVEIRGANITTGIGNSFTPLTDIKVYPNPNKGNYLFVGVNQEDVVKQVIITSITGQEMLNTKFNTPENVINLSLNNIAKGVYFVTVVTKNNRDIIKLIVQ